MKPSVTRILKPYANFGMVRPDVLEHAANRGKRVHESCHAYAAGMFMRKLDAEVEPYFQSFKLWFDSTVEEVIGTELELKSSLGFCGHPDLVAILKGDQTATVVDYKTPLSESKTWRPQLAAYHRLVNESGINAKRCLSVRLRKNGGPALVTEYETDAEDWAAFLNALYAWNYFNK